MTHYECDCCGACCQGHLIIEVYELDVLREPRLIEADPHYAGRSIAHVMTKLEEDGTCVILSAGKPCKFLNASNRCSIYPTRPNDCVAMQAGDEQCQKARRAARLPPLRPIAP
jgi:Fe-S-cluster containining protein